MNEKKKEEQQSKSTFKVTDRRKFTSAGEMRPDVECEAAPEPRVERPPERATPPVVEPTPEADDQSINFSSFLISLATTGMVHMGEIPEPTTGKTHQNSDGARQMIDILAILKRKTEGNLTPDETRLLDSLLYELRMKYVARFGPRKP